MADNIPIIDTDIHAVINWQHVIEKLPEPWRSRAASGNRGSGALGYWNPNGVMRGDTKLEDGRRVEASAETLVEHFLDVYGIDVGILNSGNLHAALSPEPDYAAALMRAGNEVVKQDWLDRSDRIRASIVVSPGDPIQAADEIRRWKDEPGFVQVMMPSGARMPYGQRYYHPIYEAAVEIGRPVAIHPGTEGSGVSGPPTASGYPSSYFEWHTGLVGSYMAHLVSLVTEGVFQTFPALTFAMVEGGVSWLPPMMWRFDKNWKALRQTTPWLERPPSEIIADHIRLTTQPMEEPDDTAWLHQMLAMFPADRMLMFSTDFPHWDGDVPDFTARLLPEDLRERVMYRTASEFYGIDAE